MKLKILLISDKKGCLHEGEISSLHGAYCHKFSNYCHCIIVNYQIDNYVPGSYHFNYAEIIGKSKDVFREMLLDGLFLSKDTPADKRPIPEISALVGETIEIPEPERTVI